MDPLGLARPLNSPWTALLPIVPIETMNGGNVGIVTYSMVGAMLISIHFDKSKILPNRSAEGIQPGLGSASLITFSKEIHQTTGPTIHRIF